MHIHLLGFNIHVNNLIMSAFYQDDDATSYYLGISLLDGFCVCYTYLKFNKQKVHSMTCNKTFHKFCFIRSQQLRSCEHMVSYPLNTGPR